MTGFAWLNDTIIEQCEAPEFPDRQAIFETILVEKGRVQLAGLHKNRLKSSLRTLGHELSPLTSGQIFDRQIPRLLELNHHHLCRVRLRVYLPTKVLPLTWIIESFGIDPLIVAYNSDGLKLGFANRLQRSKRIAGKVKHWDPDFYRDAQQLAGARGLDDILLTDEQGRIAESSIANVFWVEGGVVYTPPLSSGCVAGVMRAYLMECANALGLDIVEEPLDPERLNTAEELFLTNAIRRIKWVEQFDNLRFGNEYSGTFYQKLFGGT